jgi:hypothetical protein
LMEMDTANKQCFRDVWPAKAREAVRGDSIGGRGV